ncbi:MAG: hypothetical protein ACD_57C00363G0002 [uncultured bacterium]|nr:MAG: hypothetical protein ACD_57C00363G0002 [uncultured bacterium]
MTKFESILRWLEAEDRLVNDDGHTIPLPTANKSRVIREAIRGFLESHLGVPFTVCGMQKQLPFEISRVTCRKYLEQEELESWMGPSNNRVYRHGSYNVNMDESKPTSQNIDNLGAQAQADFYELGNRGIRKREYRVIRRF